MEATASPRQPVALLFGILSSKPSAAAIAQIADAVAPHRVVVHHDYSQVPDFAIDRSNVVVLSDPIKTSWGGWSLVAATLKLLEYAAALPGWTHFQLMSEACLPIKPVTEFEAYLSREQPDVMVDALVLDGDFEPAMMSHSWRYLPRSPRARRWARRAAYRFLGPHPVGLRTGNLKTLMPGALATTSMQRLLRKAYAAFVHRFLGQAGRFPLGEVQQCAIGGQWFGASRAAVEWLAARRGALGALETHYQTVVIPDESFIHTVFLNSPFGIRHPTNHALVWGETGNGPVQLTLEQLPDVMASAAFFARKFALDPEDPVRRVVLASVVLESRLAQTAGRG